MMTPEKMLLYKVFVLLGTHVTYSARTEFGCTYILSIKTKITTDLRRQVLEKSMTQTMSCSADDVLATIDQVYKETGGSASINPVRDEELDPGEVEEL